MVSTEDPAHARRHGVTEGAALLIRRRRPIGEPDAVAPARGVAIVEGTAGAGRICVALAEAGVELGDVVQAVVDAESSDEALDRLDLQLRFPTVVLGSHLVNLPDEGTRRAFLRLAQRHLADGGRAVVEHHPIDWADTAAPTPAMPGATVGMEDVRRHPPFVSAVSTFDVGGRYVRLPFTARVLSEAELSSELAAAGLAAAERLSPTLLVARRTPRGT